MKRRDFEQWLDAYGRAWESQDPVLTRDLFTEDAVYCENPFDEPLRGRGAIERYAAEAAGAQENVAFRYQVLALTEGGGIARWGAAFRRVPSGVEVELDGIFLVSLNSEGLCSRFEEWWHRRETPRS